MRDGVPGDPLTAAMIAIHFELIGDRRTGDRRRRERRKQCAGMAGVPGLDRRREERRGAARRRSPSTVMESAYRELRGRRVPGVQAA